MTAPVDTSQKCPVEHCYAPSTGCVRGQDLDDCAGYAAAAEMPTASGDDPGSTMLPWSGLGLGADDIISVAAIGRPIIIALVGAASAGKTTALTATFQSVRRSGGVAGCDFAGSFTMLGWYILCSYLQWRPHGEGAFPPHTTAADARSPCLQHLRLRDQTTGTIRELLLSDMPGEWFSDWAVDEMKSAGAAWLGERADGFVLFADSAALASAQRGQARSNYETLARRVHAVSGFRPVLPVLSKADISVPASIREHVNRVNASLFGTDTREISIKSQSRSVVSVLDEAIHLTMQSHLARRSRVEVSASRYHDPMLEYRSPEPYRARR